MRCSSCSSRDDVDAQLQLEVGDDAEHVGVAAHVAVAVGRALHLRRACLDRGEAARDGDVGVVVGVDADLALDFADDGAHDLDRGGR